MIRTTEIAVANALLAGIEATYRPASQYEELSSLHTKLMELAESLSMTADAEAHGGKQVAAQRATDQSWLIWSIAERLERSFPAKLKLAAEDRHGQALAAAEAAVAK